MTIRFVVPCFNEERRLDPGGYRLFLEHPRVQLLFVNDGSTDRTRPALEALCGQMRGRAKLLNLNENRGKGEAVRQGMLLAMREGADLIGYLDADLATFASRVLNITVYDTQCGAKVFRASPLLAAALSEPFAARWAFDVELLGRLLLGSQNAEGLGTDELLEMPLRRWTHMNDEKLRLFTFPVLGIELIRIKLALARWRQRRDEVLEPSAQAPVAGGRAAG